MAKKYIFETNVQKAAAQANLNSILTGSLLFVLTFVWMQDPHRFSPVILVQLVLALPLLLASMLAYAKTSYWKESELEPWKAFSWFTNNIGNIFILNAIGLMAGTVYLEIARAYFVLILLLMTTYTGINVFMRPETIWEKAFKYLFFTGILIVGGILPLLRGI